MGLVSCVASTLAADADDATESQDFQKVISYHVQRYPLLEIRDLYKLVFQAAMGSEHAAPDREAAKQWLDRELSTLSAAQKEPSGLQGRSGGVAGTGCARASRPVEGRVDDSVDWDPRTIRDPMICSGLDLLTPGLRRLCDLADE